MGIGDRFGGDRKKEAFRPFFKGENRSAAVEYSPSANFFLHREGIRLERTVGNTLLKFKSRSDEAAEIVGELLSALMR